MITQRLNFSSFKLICQCHLSVFMPPTPPLTTFQILKVVPVNEQQMTDDKRGGGK